MMFISMYTVYLGFLLTAASRLPKLRTDLHQHKSIGVNLYLLCPLMGYQRVNTYFSSVEGADEGELSGSDCSSTEPVLNTGESCGTSGGKVI